MARSPALHALEQSRLIRPSLGAPAPEYTFYHSLIQEVAYRSLLRRERRALHATAGNVLERLHAEDRQQVASQLADHFDNAEITGKAFGYHLLAAERDLQRYAHHEALLHFDRALELGTLNGVEGSEVLTAYLKRGRALELSGQHDEALENYERMAEEAQDLGRPDQRLRARIQQAILYLTGSPVADSAKGIELAERTLTEARDLGLREAEARVLWLHLLVKQLNIEELGEAVDAGQRALQLAQAVENRQLEGMIANDLGSAYGFLGQVEKATEILDHARSLMERLGNQPMLANVIANEMIVRAIAGKYAEAFELSEEGYEISEQIGNLWGQACSLLYIDVVYAEVGDYRRALEAGAQCLQLGEDSGFMVPSVISNATQAWIRGQLGLPAEGLAYVRNAPDELHGPLALSAGVLFGVRALLELAAGDLAAAERSLAEGDGYMAHSEEHILHPSMLFLALARGRVRLARGEASSVPELIEPTLQAMEEQGYRLLSSDFLLTAARAHLDAGNFEAAGRLLDEGLPKAEEMNSQRTLWRLLAARAEVHEAVGEGERAGERRRAAAAIVHDIAENVAPINLDESFLQRPDVQRLLAAVDS